MNPPLASCQRRVRGAKAAEKGTGHALWSGFMESGYRQAMPSAGLPAGAVNPTGLDPRLPPRRRGLVKAAATGVEGTATEGAAPAGLWP
jgi:hypothetical protein